MGPVPGRLGLETRLHLPRSAVDLAAYLWHCGRGCQQVSGSQRSPRCADRSSSVSERNSTTHEEPQAPAESASISSRLRKIV